MFKKILATLLVAFALQVSADQVFRPYTQSLVSSQSISSLKAEVGIALKANKFTVIGEYQPAKDANRYVFVVPHPELPKAVQKVGELAGFGSTLRVAFTKENGTVTVSYTTPEYWCRQHTSKA